MCPLCNNNKFTNLQTIKLDKLENLYQTEYNISIKNIVKTDLELKQCVECDLKTFFPIYTGPDTFYKDLSAFDWYYPTEKWEYQITKSLIKNCDQVLEVGCGVGGFQNYIQGHYTGLELNPRTHTHNILNKSVEQHALQCPNYYDIAVSFQVLEHTASPRSFIQSMINCVRPEGTIVLGLPLDCSYLGQCDDFALNLPPHHITRWSINSILKISTLFNLKLETIHFSPYDQNAYQTKFVNNPDTSKGDLVVVVLKK